MTKHEEQQELKKHDLAKGEGKEAHHGTLVTVHYTGWLYAADAKDHKGNEFDSSHKRNQPFSFKLGKGNVIKGWEEGVPGMKVGGKRMLTIPPAFGYGSRPVGNIIPANSTLLFEVELLEVEDI